MPAEDVNAGDDRVVPFSKTEDGGANAAAAAAEVKEPVIVGRLLQLASHTTGSTLHHKRY